MISSVYFLLKSIKKIKQHKPAMFCKKNPTSLLIRWLKSHPAQTVVLGFITALLLATCANPVSPSGGPRDTEPPQVVETDPPNYATGFDGDEAEIEFNEFVKLESPNDQIVISPPLKEIPEYKLRGKSIHIEFQEELW